MNTVLLFAIAAYVLIEAWRRFSDPADVPGVALLVVATVGLVVNVISFLLLRQGAKESLNVRGASLEVLSDMLGSIGVIIAGLVLIVTGWPYIDPIVGVAIGLFILPRAWRLGREALRILLQVAPADIDIPSVRSGLTALPGIADVHDLHVWTLTSGLRVATGHLDLAPGADSGTVLATARQWLTENIGIEHVTLQVEPVGFQEEKVPI
jgi:cobalt-zinc-cadmium efflux system protein